MWWNRLAALFLAVAAVSGALGMGIQPFALARELEPWMVTVCLVALAAFAGSFLMGLDRRALVRGGAGAAGGRARR